MSARDLFGIILRSFGVACLLWGLGDFLPLILAAIDIFLLPGGQDYAGGAVVHLNGAVPKLLIGVALLVWGARLARWFYPDKP